MEQNDRITTLLNCLWQVKDISISRWLVAGVFIVLSILMRRLLARGVILLVKKFSDAKTPLKDELLLSLLQPISFTIVIFGFYFAGVALAFPPDLNTFFNKVINSLITFTFFWGIYCLVEPIAGRAREAGFIKTKLSEELYFVIFRLAKVLIGVLALMTILELWNVNVFAFIASLGLLGMAVALAAQNTLKNLFGTMTILMDHSIKKGDWIKTPDVEGVVENIGFRATVIRQSDKALVTVPNAKLADAAMINFSKMPYRLIRFHLGLSYDTTADQLARITQRLRDYLFANPALETNPQNVHTVVRVDDLNTSSINILCSFFTKTTQWVEYMTVKEQCLIEMMRIIEAEGANLAIPTFYGEPLIGSRKQ